MRYTFTLIFSIFALSSLGQFDDPKLLLGNEAYPSYQFVDFDNDGLTDILKVQTQVSPSKKSIIQINRQSVDGRYDQLETLVIHDWVWNYLTEIFTHDFDEDGFIDIVLVGNEGIALYKNLVGQGLELKYEDDRENTGVYGPVFMKGISIEDFNGDGFLDVCSDLQGDFCYIAGTNSPWIFNSIVVLPFEVQGEAIDFNLDGHVDLIGLDANLDYVGLQNNGTGEFVLDVDATQQIPSGGAMYDFNGDNLLDSYYPEYSGSGYFSSNGMGDFVFNQIFPDITFGTLFTDIEGDGDIDIFFYDSNGDAHVGYNDNGLFSVIEIGLPVAIGAFQTFFDKNGDGQMDFFNPETVYSYDYTELGVFVHDSGNWIHDCYVAEGLSVFVDDFEERNSFTNNAGILTRFDEFVDGVVTRLHIETFSSSGVFWSSEFVDLNNDGFDDFLFIRSSEDPEFIEPSLMVAFGSESGWQTEEIAIGTFYYLTSNPKDPFFDFNGDGWVDFFAFSNELPIVFVNNGDGSFSEYSPEALPDQYGSIHKVAPNTILCAAYVFDTYSLYELQTDGSWLLYGVCSDIPGNPHFGDYNLDGELDVFWVSDDAVGLVASALMNPTIAWQLDGEYCGVSMFENPFFAAGSWMCQVRNFYYNPVVNLATGEVILETPNSEDINPFVVADFDNDEDLDLALGLTTWNSTVVWYENFENTSDEIELKVFVDPNGNNIFDGGESTVNIGEVIIGSNGSSWFSNALNGNYFVYFIGTEYTIEHVVD
ncbi:MAG: hypothetical protein RLZZ262_1339, partial [Bacteroidota bacterium]